MKIQKQPGRVRSIRGLQTPYIYMKIFLSFFEERSGESENGLCPIVTLRQIMWAMKMKPIKRERWETCFDRRAI